MIDEKLEILANSVLGDIFMRCVAVTCVFVDYVIEIWIIFGKLTDEHERMWQIWRIAMRIDNRTFVFWPISKIETNGVDRMISILDMSDLLFILLRNLDFHRWFKDEFLMLLIDSVLYW